MAKIDTLQDDFEFGGIDSGKWTGSSGKVVVGTNLDLEITSTAGGAYDSLDAATTYDLTGSSIFIQLTNVGDQSIASWEVYPIQLTKDASNNIRIRITGNVVQALKTVATVSSNVGSSAAYNSTTMKWFKISESGGTITFAYAADPTGSWTTLATLSYPFAITALKPQVICGTWQAESSTTTAKFDNINVTPGSLQFNWSNLAWNKRIHQSNVAGQTWSKDNISGPDSNGYLTFQLTNAAGNAPIGCEIFSVKRGFGYGTYRTVVGTKLDTMDLKIGFGGMYTFDFTASPDYKEIDCNEVRSQGGASQLILKNHSYNNGGSIAWISDNTTAVASDIVQTHRMIWQKDKIVFDSYKGSEDTGVNYSHTEQTTNIPTPGLERVHFNIYVDPSINGYATATPIDVIVRDFSYTPFMAPTVRQAEYDWYATRSGVASNAPLNDHKYAYYVSKGFGGAKKPLSQMENEWLSNIGSSSANNLYDLWVNVCQANSIPVGRSIDECKFNFYTGIASGTNP